MSTPLSEVLSLEADAVIIEDDQVNPETETGQNQEEQPATETGEEQAAPPAEETKPEALSEIDQVRSELEAYKTKAYDEKGKRQALQSKLEVLNAPAVERPDAYVNPDQAIDYGNNEIRAEFNDRFLNMSESQARGRHDDFDVMNKTFFNEMVVDNPVLAQQAMSAPDPYEFVYQQAKTHDEFKGVNSMAEYKDKLRSEMRTELEAEYADKTKTDVDNAINNALPQTLSTATATGGNQTPTWAGPTSLGNILGKK